MPNYHYGELSKALGIKGDIRGEQFIGNCPLHNDRRPSFSLNIKSGLWTCFSVLYLSQKGPRYATPKAIRGR